MVTAQSVCSFLTADPGSWSADWMFGLPLILLTVLINVLGLGLMGWRIVRFAKRIFERHHPSAVFLTVISAMTLLATSLHALDAGLWAVAYRLLGTMPDFRSAMLYSLNAMTSYGHTNLAVGRPLAAHGRDGGSQRGAPFRVEHRFPLRRDSKGLVFRRARALVGRVPVGTLHSRKTTMETMIRRLTPVLLFSPVSWSATSTSGGSTTEHFSSAGS